MDTIIAILLYMQLIQSPGTNPQSQIDQLQAQYQFEITVIQNDPQQMLEVNQAYLPKVQDVIVIGGPADARIEEKGIDLADIQVNVVKKIEELTLYVIQLQMENEKLCKTMVELETKNNK